MLTCSHKLITFLKYLI